MSNPKPSLEQRAAELAQTLKSISRQVIDDGLSPVVASILILTAIEAELQAVAAESAPRWIAVGERLPEPWAEVIVWRHDSGPFLAKRIAYCDVPEAESDSDEIAWFADQYGWQEGSEEPTHWMYPPAAPTEGKS